MEDRTYHYTGCIHGKFIIAVSEETKSGKGKERRLLIHEVLESEVDSILDPKMKQAIQFVIDMRKIATGEAKNFPPLLHVKQQMNNTIMRPTAEQTPTTTIYAVTEVTASKPQTSLWEDL